MRTRAIAIALALVVGAVALQTTVLRTDVLTPFDAGANLVLLTVLAVVRYLDPEPALLTAFTGGILFDLLGDSPLGLWAIAMTVVAFVALRVRERAADGVVVLGVGVFLLTLLGALLFVVLDSLFRQRALNDLQVVTKMVLPAVYNTVLAGAVLPGVSRLLKPAASSRWAL